MKILVADDYDALRRMIAHFLTRCGHEVVEASDGVEAIEAAVSSRFDIALLDVFMPGTSGLEAAGRIRAMQPETRIIAMTGGGDALADASFDPCRDVDCYLVKPVELPELAKLVDSLAPAYN